MGLEIRLRHKSGKYLLNVSFSLGTSQQTLWVGWWVTLWVGWLAGDSVGGLVGDSVGRLVGDYDYCVVWNNTHI